MKNLHDSAPLKLDAFEAALRSAEPNLLLAAPWLLQLVISHSRGALPTGLQTPDEQLCVIARERLLRFIEDQDLPLPADLPSGPTLILLEKPDKSWLEQTPAEQALLKYWRLMVRATVESRLRQVIPAGTTSAARVELASRVNRVEARVFEEARHVLTREHRLLSSSDAFEAYVKFAAAFTELHAFAPKLLPHVFPAIHDPARVAESLGADLDGDIVLAMRPFGAPEPSDDAYQQMEPAPARRSVWRRVRQWITTHWSTRKNRLTQRQQATAERDTMMTSADRAASVGNHVRAAILRARAYRGDRTDSRAVAGPALRELDHLVERLQRALGFDVDHAAEWRVALRPLVGPASAGWWSAEGRLLYDLQKVCVDHEREIYSVNAIEWVLELGRRKLSRALPKQRLALSARHLQSAAHRLTRCRISTPERHRLDHLLHLATHETEHRLRVQLTPPIVAALERAEFVPRNAVEAVARDKLVQELLDAVLRDGYLTFATLRDSISRNLLRCHDLHQLKEWFGYDQLMHLDRQLGDALDGVYRRGEIYRYLFQKVSSLLFASPPSRMLTRLVVLPVAGAYILVEGFSHTIGLLIAKLTGFEMHLTPESWIVDEWSDLKEFKTLAIVAVLLLGLVNWPAFRRFSAKLLAGFFHGLSFLLFRLPEQLLSNPLVLAVLRSRKVRLVVRYGVKPLIFVWLAWWLLPHDASPIIRAATFTAVFLLVNLLLNSRTGRAIEQEVLHALRVGWVQFTSEMLAHAVREIVREFERSIEAIDRMLYAVDEWLRFRHGQKRRSLVGKAFLGVLWFYIAYVARFAMNLLIEPQINPIKHFPVVTVSHKLLIPMIPSLAQGMQAVKLATGGEAKWMAGIIMTGIPGIFGFLAWELKENWKLYRANLPATLRPVHFGSHGESIAQLLRPGFHSGTLPKAYARLRKAHRSQADGERVAEGMEFPLAVHKHLEAIEHIEVSLRHFIERSFLALINRHPAFTDTPVVLSELKLGATWLRIGLSCSNLGDVPLRIEMEQSAGWIVADVSQPGWLAKLEAAPAAVFRIALHGFYHMSAVDILRADIENAFAPRRVLWELQPKHLLVRPMDRPELEVSYPLSEQTMRPQFADSATELDMPTLDASNVLISKRPLDWTTWVDEWQEANRPPVIQASATPRPMHTPAQPAAVG